MNFSKLYKRHATFSHIEPYTPTIRRGFMAKVFFTETDELLDIRPNIDFHNTNQHEHNEPHEINNRLLYKEECFKIYGCIYQVNRKLGTGFLENVYQEALEIELSRKKVPFISQKELEILYDEIPLSKKFIADIVCYNKIIIQIKAVSKILDLHKMQLTNYLSATGIRLGLLVNFNSFPKTEIIRILK